MNKCLKIAHRGVHHNAPENSLLSFEHAIEQKADVIELDIRLCGSGEVLVFHDPWLKRMTTQSGNIRKLSFDEISKYTLKDSSEKIPTLQETLDLCLNKIAINIEIKDINISNHEIAVKVISLLKEFNLPDNVWISSFNPLVLDFIKTLEPKIKTGFLFNKTRYIPLLLNQFLQFDAWHPNYELVDEEFIFVAKKKEKEVFPWTVNKLEDIQKLKSLHVTGIITDHIELI